MASISVTSCGDRVARQWLGSLAAARSDEAIHGTPGGSATVILVADEEPWLTALAAPLAARLRTGERNPLVVTSPNSPSPAVERLLSQARPSKVLLLAPGGGASLAASCSRFQTEVVPLEADPSAASLALARRFWGTSREVVAASQDDPEAIILGAALAAQSAGPLVVYDESAPATSFASGLRELGVERVWLAARDAPSAMPSWAADFSGKVEILDARALQERWIAAAEAQQVSTLVLVRVPDPIDNAGQTAWLAPYVSLARGAAVALCRSRAAEDAEACVARLISAHHLRPRSLMILADYDSIGARVVDLNPAGPHPPEGEQPVDDPYEVEVEPCMPTSIDSLASLGVGRIPFSSLADASMLFARGLLREQWLGSRPGGVLLLANSNPDELPLPLCETVARLTAEELRNCGVVVREFYGQQACGQDVRTAAASAQLILYEGHQGHERLVQRCEGNAAPADAAEERWNGLPVVILQSCDSLKEELLERVHKLGGVALVGSDTPIHSGSGSALLKSMVNGMLYRGDRLGEALRDARNYFSCLCELKDLRGHTQQKKTQRVGMSFRLWGDPELVVLPPAAQPPRRAAIAISWQAGDRLAVTLPSQRLAPVRSTAYLAKVFPGSETAGIVRPMTSSSLRELAPLCFFRVPLPPGVAAERFRGVRGPDGGESRIVCRVDPAGDLLYVLYFPSRQSPNETFTLHFVGGVPRSGKNG